MIKIRLCLISVALIWMAGCKNFSQSSEKLLTGLQVSSGMSDEAVEEEAKSGQMRNIK